MDTIQETSAEQAAEIRWLNKAENWGEWQRVPDDRPGKAESMWLMVGADGNVRFYAVGRGQVGPPKGVRGVYPAACWAWGNRWLWTEPDGTINFGMQLECRKWVLAGGAVVA